MEKDVVTANENDNLEDAANLMLKHDIGCVVVVNNEGELTGILTQNDLFAAFVDLLGYNEVGTRVNVEVEDKMGEIGELCKIFTMNNCSICLIGVYERNAGRAKIVFHVGTTDVANLKQDLEKAGVTVLGITTKTSL